MIELSRPIAYSVNLARVTGDAKACLFLSQLVYWTRVGTQVVEHGGWIFKTRAEWTTETGLSRAEQETARRRLLASRLIEEQRVGAPLRSCYRVELNNLGAALAAITKTQVEQLELLEVRNSTARIRVLFGANLAYHRSFVELTGSVTTAIFLARVVQLSNYMSRVRTDRNRRFNRGADKPVTKTQDASKPMRFDDWFSVESDQWVRDTGLTQAQQRRAQSHLVGMEIIQEAMQSFPRRKVFIRMDETKLAARMAEHQTQAKKARLKDRRVEKSEKPVSDSQVSACENQPSGFTQTATLDGQFSHTCADTQSITAQTEQTTVSTTVRTVKVSGLCEVVAPQRVRTNSEPVNKSSSEVSNASDLSFFDVAKNATVNSLRSEIASTMAGFSMPGRRVLASLRARVKGNDYISITTTTKDQSDFVKPKSAIQNTPVVVVCADAEKDEADDLIWSIHLDAAELQLCKSRLQKLHGISKSKRQELVDEFTGNLDTCDSIRHPVRYFTALIKRFQAGEFVADVAHEVAGLRAAHAQYQARMQALNRELKSEKASTDQVTVTGLSASAMPIESPEVLAARAVAHRALLLELSKKYKAEILQKNSLALSKNLNQGNHGNHS